MAHKKDRLGQTFGRLKVIGEAKSVRFLSGRLHRYLKCICICGNKVTVDINNLRNSQVRSCGCLAKEGNNKSHGMSGTRFYNIWNSLDNRQGRAYKNITAGKRWKCFLNFKDDMYLKYINHCNEFGIKETTIDRINNKLGYFTKNCRWATRLEQARNKKGVCIFSKKLKSKNIGITYFKNENRKKRWQAHICIKYKKISLGYFKTKIEARLARKKAEIKYNRIYE